MTALMCLIALTISPKDVVRDAVNAGPQPGYRYFSLHATPPDRRDRQMMSLIYTLNQLNMTPKTVSLIKISDTVFAVDATDLRWDPQAWEKLGAANSTFKGAWINSPEWTTLCVATGSNYPIVRADEFIFRASKEFYYDFMFGVGKVKTREELFKRLGIDPVLIDTMGLKSAGIVVNNLTVTKNPRQLFFRPGPLWVWTSRDVKDSVGNRNVLKQIDVSPGPEDDLEIIGEEHIFKLPWGGFGGFLNDAAGKRIDEVPINVAIDRDSHPHGPEVAAARNCWSCHTQAVKSFTSDFTELLKKDIVRVTAADKHTQRKIEEIYNDINVQDQLDDQQSAYGRTIFRMFGEEPAVVAKAFTDEWNQYGDGLIDIEVAAREAGCDPGELSAVLATMAEPMALMLLPQGEDIPGRTIPRSAWDDMLTTVLFLLKNPGAVPSRVLQVGLNTVTVPKDQPIEKYDSDAIQGVKVEGGKAVGASLQYPVTVSPGVGWVEIQLKGGSRERFEVRK